MSRMRLLFISIAIVLLVVAGTVLILSVGGILQGWWTNLLTAFFLILSVLIGFLQWALPFSSAEPKTPRGSSKSDEDILKADITLFEENSDPKRNQFLSRFNLNRRQRLDRVNPVEVLNEYDVSSVGKTHIAEEGDGAVEVLNEYDVSSGDIDDTSDDCTLRYFYERIDNKIWIKPEMPYLSLLSQGGPIVGRDYFWWPFQWQFPKLSVKLVNTNDHTLLLSEAVIRVTSSKINVEPILVIHEDDYNVGHFRILNEGWGQVIKPVISFRITKSYQDSFSRYDESQSEATEQTVQIKTFTDTVNISIMDYVPKNLRHERSVAVSGSIQYSTEAQENRVIKFKTKVSFVMPGRRGSGGSAPPTSLYDLFLKAGESNDTKFLPISQEIKPGESDHFLIRVASDKSARFDLTFSFRETGGKEILSRDVVLDLFIPRSQQSDW